MASATMVFKPPFRGTMEFAACSISNKEKKWCLQSNTDFCSDVRKMTQGGTYGGGLYFPSPQNTAMDSTGDGTFLFAVLIDGVRCSNVIRVTIKHDYDAKMEPPLRVFAIQPLSGDTVQQLGVWVTPPVADKKLTNFVASAIDLSIDGEWHTTSVGAWDGAVYMLKPNVSDGESCFFDFYKPPIAPFKRAKVQARLLNYTSAITEVSFDSSDARQYDQTFGLK